MYKEHRYVCFELLHNIYIFISLLYLFFHLRHLTVVEFLIYFSMSCLVCINPKKVWYGILFVLFMCYIKRHSWSSLEEPSSNTHDCWLCYSPSPFVVYLAILLLFTLKVGTVMWLDIVVHATTNQIMRAIPHTIKVPSTSQDRRNDSKELECCWMGSDRRSLMDVLVDEQNLSQSVI